MKTAQWRSTIALLCCCVAIGVPSGFAQVSGEKFTVASGKGLTMSKTTRAEDFNLYDLMLNGRFVARLYEGDNPDFQYDKAVDKPRTISAKTTLLSTHRTSVGKGFKRDHLVEFSGCDGFCTIHVWYDGVTASEADRIDAFVRGIRRKNR